MSDHKKSTSCVKEMRVNIHKRKLFFNIFCFYIHGLSVESGHDKLKFLTQTEMCQFFPFHSALCKTVWRFLRNCVCCVIMFWSITLSCSLLDSGKYNHLRGLTILGVSLPSYVFSFSWVQLPRSPMADAIFNIPSIHLNPVDSFQCNFFGGRKTTTSYCCLWHCEQWMRYMNISGQLCLLYCFSLCVLDMSLWLSRACTLDSISTELSLHSRWLVNERQRFYASSVICAQYRIWAVCPSEWPF